MWLLLPEDVAIYIHADVTGSVVQVRLRQCFSLFCILDSYSWIESCILYEPHSEVHVKIQLLSGAFILKGWDWVGERGGEETYS